MQLYGRSFTRNEIIRRGGRMEQFGGIRRSVIADGAGRGNEIAHVRTGSGLSFHVHPSRGMDIGIAEWCGLPLAWVSPTGHVSPHDYEAEGKGWLRGFYGGLLTTCGLRHFGGPTVRGGEPHGQHGRIAHIPAENVFCTEAWEGDDYVFSIEGTVREASVFGENLSLRRRISCKLGESRIRIDDWVTNEGFRAEEHMIMYHFNLGFPLLDEHAEIIIPNRGAMPRDPGVAPEESLSYLPPMPDYEERVFFHDTVPDSVGLVTAGLWNPKLRHPVGSGEGLGLFMTYPKERLPWMTQWKMPGEGIYVLGMEPCNRLLADGPLKLEPGQQVHYRIELKVACTRPD